MDEILKSITNREWAALFWVGVLVVAVVLFKPARKSLGSVLKNFIQPVILVPLLLAALYAIGEIYLLSVLEWWSIANLKTTVLWLAAFAFVAMFEIVSMKARKAGLRKITRDILTVTTLFVFITQLHSFPLAVEIIALPIVTFLGLLFAVAELKPEHAPVSRLVGCVVGLIGLGYFGFSVWMTFENWAKTATSATGLEFIIPILLSFGFLPFLFGWRLYLSYSETFSRLAVFGIGKELIPYARWLALTGIRSDLELLGRWQKETQKRRPSSKDELKEALIALRTLKKRETSPPTVQPKDGWSPYLAMQYLSELGYEMDHYTHSYDGEWFASSPLREIGEALIWKNNIAYYVEGSEHSATTLKLKLNINDPASAEEAEILFRAHARHLLEHAISLDAVERMEELMASLEPFSEAIPFGTVSLSREDYVGGIEGGYSRKFEIIRGIPQGTA